MWADAAVGESAAVPKAATAARTKIEELFNIGLCPVGLDLFLKIAQAAPSRPMRSNAPRQTDYYVHRRPQAGTRPDG
jgi:hypothetical protein